MYTNTESIEARVAGLEEIEADGNVLFKRFLDVLLAFDPQMTSKNSFRGVPEMTGEHLSRGQTVLSTADAQHRETLYSERMACIEPGVGPL